MKILHASTRESRGGGAAIAAKRLHLGLLAAGVDSHMAVAIPQEDSPRTFPVGGKISRNILRPLGMRLEAAVRACYPQPEQAAYASFSFCPSLQHVRLNNIPKDILHLHSVVEGFLSPWALGRLRGPVVWTMHDAWPFTGGCHYWSTPCLRYEKNCGCCPLLGCTGGRDLSYWHWYLKHKAVQRLKPVIVSPSTMYARKAANSGILGNCRIEVILNGIDVALFKHIPKEQARNILDLPQDMRIILFGAISATSDRNKGYDLLLQALYALPAVERELLLAVVFGASEAKDALPCPSRFLGRLHDEISLALAYSAADIFICPSRHEAFSLTTLEALACGTPVVAFAVGGIPDMVDHGLSGYLATPYAPDDLASGIALLLNDVELCNRMGEAGREKVLRKFALDNVVQQYLNLYNSLLDAEKHD